MKNYCGEIASVPLTERSASSHGGPPMGFCSKSLAVRKSVGTSQTARYSWCTQRSGLVQPVCHTVLEDRRVWVQSSVRDVLSHLSNTWPSARIVFSSVVRRRSCCLLFPISVSGGASSGLVRTVRGLGLSRRTGRHTISCETWLRACACVRTLAILYEPSVEVAPSVWFGSVHIELNSPPRSPSRLNAVRR